MKQYKNLVTRNKEISNKILNSLYLIEILQEIMQDDTKAGVLSVIIEKNLRYAFREIETCRSFIATGD